MVISSSAKIDRGTGDGGESPLCNGSLLEHFFRLRTLEEHPDIDPKTFLLVFIVAIEYYWERFQM